MRRLESLLLLAALTLFPLVSHAQREKLPPDDYDFVMKKWPDAQMSNSGIRYIVEKKGSGPTLERGNLVSVLYTGMLLNGKVFDQNHDVAHPFRFRLGRGEVIQGWDHILQLMRPGDKWLVIVPPELAYGRRGSPPMIPGDATLVFDVEVLGIAKEN
jgi:FKBP-type peptidyl-prolyl cis-trans isomerase